MFMLNTLSTEHKHSVHAGVGSHVPGVTGVRGVSMTRESLSLRVQLVLIKHTIFDTIHVPVKTNARLYTHHGYRTYTSQMYTHV